MPSNSSEYLRGGVVQPESNVPTGSDSNRSSHLPWLQVSRLVSHAPIHPKMISTTRPSQSNLPVGGEATDAPSSSSDDETLVSIVVPTYNRSSMLAGALETLANQKLDPGLSSEIVVVDNASTDETRDVVEGLRVAHPAARIRYVYEARQGQAFALNRGAAEARGDWIAIFDDDQLAPPSWLLELWNTARQRDAAIVGGPIHLHLDEMELAGLDPVCRGALRELHSYDEIHA